MASFQVEISSSTSPFDCINTRNHHHGATQPTKQLFNHFMRDHLDNKNNNNINNSHSWVGSNNNAKSNLKSLRFTSSKREQDELERPNHEEPSSSSSSSSSSSPLRKQNPSPISVIPSSNLGASSLVQIWEKRLTQSSNAKSSTPRSSPNVESSPQASSEEANSPQGKINSEANQNERTVRMADIIKRLTATGEDMVENQVHQEQSCMGSPEHSSENRSFVINSPRIRGRQAFNDLLMQMEKDRHGELNNLAERSAVSKFSHKGRIQALLRLRLMQQGIVAKDQSRSLSSTSQVIKQPQGSLIMRLRKRFTRIESGTAVEAEAMEPRTPCKEKENKVKHLDNPPNTTQNPVSPTDHSKEKALPCSDISEQFSETQNVETSSSSMADDLNAEVQEKEEGSDQEKHDDVADQNSYDEIEEEEEEEEEEGSKQEYGERIYDEIEEVETSEQIYGEANFDWVSQISKPRSYWEDRRQAWYKEILDNVSENDELCQLLRRRTVSNFLSSAFRERMDRLMESHKGTRMDLFANHQDDDDEDHHGKIEQLVALLQRHMHSAERDHEGEIEAEGDEEDDGEVEEEEEHEDQEDEDDNEEEEDDKHEDQEEEEEILISGSYNGESDSINQSLPSPWRYGGNEGGDDFEDRSASASIRQPSQSPSFYQDSHRNSWNPPSIEMELIYDLRRHMKQLYEEMSELRKSIKSCIDMQMIRQKSLNLEDHTAKGGRKSHGRVLKKGNCCICSEMKADSLLYRCGHMCTCLKCANELQWKNEMCPICEAPIVDVVRVYVDA